MSVNWVLMPVRAGLKMTQDAVKSVLTQDITPVRVLLIDNDTDEGIREWARTKYPRVMTITKYPPLSVAESWNKGLSLLFNDTGNTHVLVCNNDVVLRKDTYRLLVEDGGDFVTAVGNSDPDCVKALTPPVVPPRPNPDFSCFLLTRKVWETVGKFDEQFRGAFCEDWDYHVRLHMAGIDAHCIDIPFYHIGSATINIVGDSERDRLQKWADQNRKYFKEKYGFDGGSPEYEAFFKTAYRGR